MSMQHYCRYVMQLSCNWVVIKATHFLAENGLALLDSKVASTKRRLLLKIPKIDLVTIRQSCVTDQHAYD